MAKRSIVGLHGRELENAAFAIAAARWKDAAANPRNAAAAALVAQAAGNAGGGDDDAAAALLGMRADADAIGGLEDEEEYADALDPGACDSDSDDEMFDADEIASDAAGGAVQQCAGEAGEAGVAAGAHAGPAAARATTRPADPKGTPNRGMGRKTTRRR